MKPNFLTIKSNYYSSAEGASNYKSGSDLYSEMGIDFEKRLKENPSYINTCAIRISLALIKSGVVFSGRRKIQAGKYKGRLVEPGAKLLADQLMRKDVFGRPEIMQPDVAQARIGTRKGVVFFNKVTGYDGGHIDLIDGTNNLQVCGSHCYFNCKEVWFWPLE